MADLVANRRHWDGGRPVPVDPVAARLLRPRDPGGCATLGVHRLDDGGGVEFYLPHGERTRLLRDCGFEIDDLVEVQAPAGGVNEYISEISLEWANRQPSEEVGSPAVVSGGSCDRTTRPGAPVWQGSPPGDLPTVGVEALNDSIALFCDEVPEGKMDEPRTALTRSTCENR